MKMNSDRNSVVLLEKCNNENVEKFLHGTVDRICGRAGPLYQSYSNVWSLEEWWEVTEAVRSLYLSSVKSSNGDLISDALASLPAGLAQTFQNVLQVRADDIRQHLLSETSCTSRGVLTDFDWKLKMVLGSDKMSTIREPVLSLELRVQDGNASNVETLELNKDELKKLVTSLEGAHKVVTQLKV